MSDAMEKYERDLPRTPANFQPLSPLGFLARAAAIYPRRRAIIDRDRVFSYAQFRDRCLQLASALHRRGVTRGDTVSVLAPNCEPLLAAHFGVPMCGAVLNALNYRLDAATIAFIVEHAQTKVLLCDTEYAPVLAEALSMLDRKILVIDINDVEAAGGHAIGEKDFEAFLLEGDADFGWQGPDDEWDAIALNYTSGTTGDPKGVVYHHRGAFLNAMSNAMVFGVDREAVYLWTLPMFHCNGWTYPWAVTAVAGTHVILRNVEPDVVFDRIEKHGVTHMCGAPIVLNMLANSPRAQDVLFDHRVEVATGGAAPPSSVISAMEKMGFRVTHLYGLTESYGPATYCAWQDEWSELALEARAEKMARQGVPYPTLSELQIIDPATGEPVPADGQTVGEIVMRGNTVMKGYLKNPNASAQAFADGWFHSGDLGVMHPDGYVEIKDRSKDIIISGGENISSLEIEEVLYRHASVLEAAVVAKPDETWGETPC
ncbi:MAG: fatty-acyl-CoA synthase, partial [Gammaproteobacteria bacterium]